MKLRWKKKSVKFILFKLSAYFILTLLGFFLLDWTLSDSYNFSEKTFYMADLNTLQCTLMQEELGKWLSYQKKNDNPCEVLDFGNNKYVLACSKGQNMVIGSNPQECLEAGVNWKKRITKGS